MRFYSHFFLIILNMYIPTFHMLCIYVDDDDDDDDIVITTLEVMINFAKHSSENCEVLYLTFIILASCHI